MADKPPPTDDSKTDLESGTLMTAIQEDASTTPKKQIQDASTSSLPRELLSSSGQDPEEDDWAQSPHNPMNWPLGRKLLHSAIPAIYTFGLTTGISTLVATVPLLMSRFSISRNVALLPISLYTLGLVIGSSIASPLSEIYGRRIIYWTNFPILFLFNAIAAGSDNFVALVICRFIAGVGGSGVLAVGAGTLSELWEPKDAGRVTVSYIIAPFLGPTLGPLIGAYTIHQYGNDWKWGIWVVLCILAPVGIALCFMKETSKKQILESRAGKNGGEGKVVKSEVTWKQVGAAMLRPLHMCLVEVCPAIHHLPRHKHSESFIKMN